MDLEEKYKVIGIMSGTSLDGVDLACCIIRKREGQWVYIIESAQTVKYSKKWIDKLSLAPTLSGVDLALLDREYGKYLGLLVQAFIMKSKVKGVHFIASHGHTIFHQPTKKLTYQLGNGYELHAATRLPVVYDFRSLDVALGGQGAPLVPIGDKLLFPEYDCCLNLGGIANISFDVSKKRKAFDVCFVNMGLNYLASLRGATFDKNGEGAEKGIVSNTLLQAIDKEYGKMEATRPSLSAELFLMKIKPVLDNAKISTEDKLATFVESIAFAIVKALPRFKSRASIFVTGGGAHNSFLIYRLLELMQDKVDLIVPEPEVIDYKEALIFSFLGVLKVRSEINTLKSVTGASKDSCSGIAIGF